MSFRNKFGEQNKKQMISATNNNKLDVRRYCFHNQD